MQSLQLPYSSEGEPVFPEPWAAEAFAMTVHLHEKGLFSWAEWAETLSRELHRPGRADDGSDYFDCWVAALSDLLVNREPVQTVLHGELPDQAALTGVLDHLDEMGVQILEVVQVPHRPTETARTESA